MNSIQTADVGPEISGVTYNEVDLTIEDGLSFDNWQDVGVQLATMHQRCGWWLGDWYNWGENNYGEMASQARSIADHALAAGWQLSPGTIQDYAYLAKKFKIPDRSGNLGIQHYRVVRALPDSEAKKLLKKADKSHWTVAELKAELRGDGARATRQAPSVVKDAPSPTDTQPLPPYKEALEGLVRAVDAWIASDFVKEDDNGIEHLNRAKEVLGMSTAKDEEIPF